MKTLIFDFDGTIADSFKTLLKIFEEISPSSKKLTKKEVEFLRGRSLKEITKYVKIRRWQIPGLLFKGKRLLAERMPEIKTFDQLPKILGQLKADGNEIYILSTNSSTNIEEFLKTNNLDSYFTKIYGDIGLRTKSSALKKIIKKENIETTDCAYIGDEVRDVEAAKKAGITSVAVGWGFNYPEALEKAQPDFLARKPLDLLHIW